MVVVVLLVTHSCAEEVVAFPQKGLRVRNGALLTGTMSFGANCINKSRRCVVNEGLGPLRG